MTLNDLVKDKKVAIVGPAGCLENSFLGEEIDSFDIVVRMNRALPIQEDMKKHIGTKTDVMMHSLCREPTNTVDLNEWKRNGIKLFFCPFSFETDFIKRDYNMVKDRLHKMFEVDCAAVETLRELTENMKSRPTTGTMALKCLVDSPLKELHIYGMTFEKNKNYSGYKPVIEKCNSTHKYGDIKKYIEGSIITSEKVFYNKINFKGMV